MTQQLTAQCDVRSVLHQLTADIHGEVECLWSDMGTFATRCGYIKFLEKALAVHCNFGVSAVQTWGNDCDEQKEMERIDCLVSDLESEPVSVRKKRSMSKSYAWGVSYVLNGSALGASFMLKRGGIPTDWPSSYFGYGRSFVRSGHLKAFFDRLNSADIEMEEALVGAADCFGAFAEKCREPNTASGPCLRSLNS